MAISTRLSAYPARSPPEGGEPSPETVLNCVSEQCATRRADEVSAVARIHASQLRCDVAKGIESVGGRKVVSRHWELVDPPSVAGQCGTPSARPTGTVASATSASPNPGGPTQRHRVSILISLRSNSRSRRPGAAAPGPVRNRITPDQGVDRRVACRNPAACETTIGDESRPQAGEPCAKSRVRRGPRAIQSRCPELHCDGPSESPLRAECPGSRAPCRPSGRAV